MDKFFNENTDEIFSYDDLLSGNYPKCMSKEDSSKLPWVRTIHGYKYNNDGSCNLGDVSDGYHTFNELYEHRTILFACLCKTFRPDLVWKSDLHSDGTMYDGMFIVGIKTEFGTVTYHIENKYKSLFKSIKSLDKAPEWDGSTPKDGLEYLMRAFKL